MIASLTGTISLVDSKIIVTVGGVGYLVTVTSQHLAKLNRLTQDEVTTLFIYTHVREENLDLYGFENWAQRGLFLLVLSVSGIGPSSAMHILQHDQQSIIRAIQEADVSFFTKIPRIGKKVAQKIIIELGSKLGEVKSLELGPQSGSYKDVLDSLVALGFSENAVETTLREIDFTTTSPEDAVKAAIKTLSKK